MENWTDEERKAWQHEWKAQTEEFQSSINFKESISNGQPIELDLSTLKALNKHRFERNVDQIYKNAATAPKHITYEDAYASLCLPGRDYSSFWLDAYSDKLDPYDRFWITIDAYAMAPYKSIPKKRIIDLRKIRPSDYLKNLDPELSDVDPLTVYRGSPGDCLSVRNDFSWTTDPVIAIFFMNKKANIEAHLWKGTIFKDKIIATENGRNEHEIIQHCGVNNICEVKLTEDQIKAALEEYELQIKIWEYNMRN